METRCSAVALALMAAPAAGCAVATEAPDAVGYVLLDHEAQAAGKLSQGTWAGAPVLPVALEVGEPVAFAATDGRGRLSIDLRPGMLAWIHGAGGAVEWRAVGDDVSGDRLRVHGTREAAVDLAQRVAGELVGPADTSGEVWTIAAPGVLDRGSFLAAPAGVTEVAPDPRLDLGSSARPQVLADTSAGMPEAARQALWVGLYTAGDRTLFLDAAGGFSLAEGCFLTTVDHGRWHPEGDHVVLDGADGARVLDYEPTAGDLRGQDGERFSSALMDSAAAAMPALEAP